MAVRMLSRSEILIFDSSPDLDEARRFLESPRFRLEGWRVGLVVHGARVRGGTPPNPGAAPRAGAVSLYGSHARDNRGEKGARGWDAVRVRERIQAEGGLKPALAALANERPGTSLEDVTRVEVHLWRPQ